MVTENKKLKTASELIGSGSLKDFHPDLDQEEVDAFLDTQIELVDAQLVKGWTGDYGDSNFCLLMVRLPEDPKAVTTLAGGTVLFKRISALVEGKYLPCLITIVKEKSRNDFEYYNIR